MPCPKKIGDAVAAATKQSKTTIFITWNENENENWKKYETITKLIELNWMEVVNLVLRFV